MKYLPKDIIPSGDKWKFEKFLKDFNFARYEVEEDGELVFFTPSGEVMVIREFIPGSPTDDAWQDLQDIIDLAMNKDNEEFWDDPQY